MPSALSYVPPTDRARDAFNLELIQEKTTRRQRYLNALKYYDGNHPEQLEYDADAEPNDNTTINLVQITADRTSSFLFPSIPTFQVDPNAIEQTEEELWITKMLDESGGLPMLIRLALRGFLAGHAFMRVVPGQKRGRRKSLPKLVVLDPLAITIFWRADDVGDVLWYENRYKVGEDIYVQDYVNRPEAGEAGEWEIHTYKAAGADLQYLSTDYGNSSHGAGSLLRSEYMDYVSAASFKRVLTEAGGEFAVHASHIPPLIEFGHLPHPDDRYGHGEVSQTNLQDTINRVWSEINRIVRKHSNPVDVITGADVSDVEIGQDVMTVPSENAKVQRLEMRSDLDAAVKTVEKLVETFLAVSRVVLLKGEAKDLQRVTNASVRTLFIDALAKNEILRHAYGHGLVQAVTVAMQMSGEPFATKAQDMSVICKWGEALPVDKTEIANINAIQQGMGARSLRTAATEIGDDWAFEQAASKVEMAEKLTRMVAEMTAMAAAAPKQEQVPGAKPPAKAE